MPTPRETTRAALAAAAYATWLAQQPQPELSDADRPSIAVALPIEEDVLTVAQICRLRGVTTDAVLDLIHRGILAAQFAYRPAIIPGHCAWYIAQSEYDRYIAHPYVPRQPPRRLAVEKRERANGFLTMGEVRRMLGVTRTRLDHICRRKTNPLPRQRIDGVWFIRRIDAQCEVDARTRKALQNMVQSD